jgi:hypothetical protein
MNDFAIQNANKLAAFSDIFCKFNGIAVDQTTSDLLAMTVMGLIYAWYEDKGRSLDPCTELIDDEAIGHAFAQLQCMVFSALAENGMGEA